MKQIKPIFIRSQFFRVAFFLSIFCLGSLYSTYISAQTFAVTINQQTSQTDPASTMPAAYKVVFATAINPATFDASDIILSGTATGKSVVAITEIAPNNGTTFEVTITATGEGTIIPTIPAASCNYAFSSVVTTVLDIARDASGNLFTAGSSGIYKITPAGVSTFITGSLACSAITVDASGNVYSAKSSGGGIQKIAAGASTATNFISTAFAPRGITTDAAGNVYTANATSNNVTKVTPAGVATVLGTTGTSPQDVVIDASGNVYTPNQTTNNVSKITAAGVSSVLGTTGTGPVSIAIDASGNIYTANSTASNVSKITPAGVSSVFVSLAAGASPSDVVLDAAGNLYVANNGSSGGNLFTISKVTSSGVASILCNLLTRPRAMVFDNSNSLYVGNSNNSTVHKVAISGNAIEIASLTGSANAASTSTDNQVTYAPPNFSFDCSNPSTMVVAGFYANANPLQAGTIEMSLTGTQAGTAVFTFSGYGFTSTPYATVLSAGQTTVSLPFTYDGLGFSGTRTVTVKSVQAIGTDSCTKNVSINSIAGGANFSFLCNAINNGIAGTLVANGVPGQTASYVVGVTNPGGSPALRQIFVSGPGISGSLVTSLSPDGPFGTNYISIPITYDGTGSPGSISITLTSPQSGSGVGSTCSKSITLSTPPATFVFDCGSASTSSTFYANGSTQTGSITIPLTSATAGPATFSVSGTGFSGSLSTTLTAGQTSVNIPIFFQGTGAVGTRTLNITSAQGTGSCTMSVSVIPPPVATFSFDCSTASITGTFVANGINPQTGSLTIPLSGATAGTASFSVSGSGFTGSLSTTLTANQTSVVVPITYNASGSAGSVTLSITSPEGSGTCTKSIAINAQLNVTINQQLTQADPTAIVPVLFTVVFNSPIIQSSFTSADIILSGTATGKSVTSINEVAPMNGTAFEVSVNATGVGTIIAAIPAGSYTYSSVYIPNGPNGSRGIVKDAAGNIYTTSSTTTFINKLTPSGVNSVFALVPALAGSLAIDPSGNLYVGTEGGSVGNVTKITPSGVVSVLGSTAISPRSIALDAAGNVYAANLGSNNVTKITPAGVSTVLGTTGTNPNGIVIDASGNVYTSNQTSNNITKISPAGVSTIFATLSASPVAIAIDASGNLYSANANNTVSKISASGVVSLLASTGSASASAIAIDAAGNLFVTIQTVGTVLEISQAGVVTFLGAAGSQPVSIMVDASNTVYVASVNNNLITKFSLAFGAGISDQSGSNNLQSTSVDSTITYLIPLFTFNCGSASATGTFIANGTTGQAGTLTIPINGAIAGSASFSVSGSGFAGALSTILTTGQTSVAIPIIFDGSGSAATVSLTITSAQGTGSCSTNVVVSGVPDLITTIGQPLTPLIVGQPSDIPVTVSNIGNGPAPGVITTIMTLPPGTSAPPTFTSNGSTCATSLLTITCTNAGPIAAGGSIVINIPTTPDLTLLGGTPTFNANTTPLPSEINTGNNPASPTTVTTPVVGVPDLTTSVGQPLTPLIVGQPSDIPVTVSNIGSGPAPGVITTIMTLPPGTSAPPTFTSNGSTCSTSLLIVTCTNAGPIAAGGSIVINIPTTPDNTLLGTTPTINATTTPLPSEINTVNNPASPTTVTTPVGSAASLTVTINKSATQIDATNNPIIHFTVVFSQAINPSTFDFSDIAISGTACIANGPTLTTTDSITWDILVEAGCDGTIIASIAANAVSTISGTANSTSTSTDNSVLYDATPPSIYEVNALPSPTNNPTPQYTFNSTEMGTLQFFGDCSSTTTNAVAGNNTITFNTLTEGLHVCALQVTDSLGNLGNIMIISSFMVDLTGPSITINQSTSQVDPTSLNPMSFTMVFSEAINPLSFLASDITLSGTATATVGTPTTSDNITWTVPVTASTAGTIVAAMSASKVTDEAGNNNNASTSTDNMISFIINASLTFNCGAASSTGTFTANGVTGQNGTLTIPITSATAGSANFTVSGTGFTGSLSTTLTTGQTSVSVPISFNGSGVAGSRTLSVASVQASGTCNVIVNVIASTSDIDSDGFPDSTDLCPTIAGIAPHGCPLSSIGQSFNPFVTQALISPSPLYNAISNGIGQISMIIGNSGDDAMPLIVGQEMKVAITLSNGIPDSINPLNALSGSFVSHFNWQYDTVTKTYSGIQNQLIGDALNGGVGIITIDYKVTANSTSAMPQNGFSCTITPPAYTFISNTQFDDFGSSYTWTIPKLNPNPDFIITIPGTPTGGDLGINDQIIPGTIYNNPPANPGNPSPCAPIVASNGTFTFSCTTPGEYNFMIPVCEPSPSTLCFDVPLQITVTAPPSPTAGPIANPDALTTVDGSPITTNVTANDACMNGATCTLSNPTIVTGPTNSGSTAVVNPNGTITFTPAPGFTGKDSILYAVCDNQTPTAKCDSEWVYITVLPQGSLNSTNAGDDFSTASFGATINGNVASNDTDPEGHTQSVTAQTTTVAGKGTLTLTSTGTYTFTPVTGFSGAVDFPYTTCDNGTPSACATATLHILVQQGAPDLTPNITMIPNVMHGVTSFNVTVRVTELNSVTTNGLITVRIPKDTRVSFTYNSAATLIGFTAVSNSTWTYVNTNPFFHIFTRSASINGGAFSTFGFNASFNPANSDGKYSMTSTISSGSGGENKSTNNTDSESADYFHN